MCLKNTFAGLEQGKQVAGEDRWRSAMLEEEVCHRRVCHDPQACPTCDACKTGQNHSVSACGSRVGFRPLDLVAVDGGGRHSSGERCHPTRP